MEDEAVARVKAEETQVMKDDAQRDLNQALPAVEKANEAIGRLKKESIGEVRTFTKPPHMVEVVMQAVCIMFEKKKVRCLAPHLHSLLFIRSGLAIGEALARRCRSSQSNSQLSEG